MLYFLSSPNFPSPPPHANRGATLTILQSCLHTKNNNSYITYHQPQPNTIPLSKNVHSPE